MVWRFSDEGVRRLRRVVDRVENMPFNKLPQLKKEYRPPSSKASSNGGGGGGDGTGCCGALIQGVPLDGSPTVCCEGHNQLRVDMGPTIGIKNLWHAGGDVWSTFSDDPEDDNPFERTCCLDDPPPTPPDPCETEATDEYDVVLDISTGMITLEARAALNCDPICARWKMVGDLFQCFGSNEFRIQYFDGMENVELKQCLCVTPVPELPSTPVFCLTDPNPSPYPEQFYVVIKGYRGPGIEDPPGSCFTTCSEQFCESLNGVYLVSRSNQESLASSCSFLGGGCMWAAGTVTSQTCPPTTGAINMYVSFRTVDNILRLSVQRSNGSRIICATTDPIEVSDPLQVSDFMKVFTFTTDVDLGDNCLCIRDDWEIQMFPIGTSLPPANSGHCASPCNE